MPAAIRSGFTIMELMAALTLTGVALLGAWQLIEQLADGRDRVAAAGEEQTTHMNGQRLLRSLVYRAEVGVDSMQRFFGSELDMHFQSWCDAPGGWLERCDVALSVATVRVDSSTITAIIHGYRPLILWAGAVAASFCYLDDDRTWVRRWESNISLPAAVGVVLERDTLVLPAGAGR